jgi:hypothetical protein
MLAQFKLWWMQTKPMQRNESRKAFDAEQKEIGRSEGGGGGGL